MSKDNKKKFNLYRFLNEGNDNKGIEKFDKRKKESFFAIKLFGRRFGALVKLNLMWFIGNFPIFFILFALSGYAGNTTTTPYNPLFANLHPLVTSGKATPIVAALYGVTGIQGNMLVWTTTTYIFLALGLLLFLTFGLVNLGVTYNMRNIVRGEPLFLLSDFWDSIKKNWRQGLLFGIIDLALIALLIWEILFVYRGIIQYLCIGMLVIYLVMRFYIYILIPTFDLTLAKVIKNSFIFVVLNMKRNIGALACIIGVIALNFVLMYVFLPIGMVMPFAITVSACMYISAYAAWPKIKEIMVDPYDEDEPEEREEPIFKDRG